jgi:hypothetical protein
MIDRGQTVQEVISPIWKVDRSDVNTLFLDDAELPPHEPFDAFYELKDQLFVFLKASTPAMTSPLSHHPPPASASPVPSPPDLSASDSLIPSVPSRASHSRSESSCAASTAGGGPVSDSVRDFGGREVRVLGKGAFGVAQLLEDASAHDLIAVKFFDSETRQIFDNRFAAKAQHSLEFSPSAALRPAPRIHLSSLIFLSLWLSVK